MRAVFGSLLALVPSTTGTLLSPMVTNFAILDGLFDAPTSKNTQASFRRTSCPRSWAPPSTLYWLAAAGRAVVGGGDEVHVAVDAALPAHVHGLGIDAGEQRLVLGRIVQIAPVVGLRGGTRCRRRRGWCD